MNFQLGQDWEIIPAGGATGEAFFAIKEDQRLFLKRNSSPFLAVLSAEGIVPKLIWTKRMENGDVITAQQCLVGREFKAEEMAKEEVAKLLRTIHQSRPLLTMLARMEKTPYDPEQMLRDTEAKLDPELFTIRPIVQALAFLKKEVPFIRCDEWAVCHGDVNHNNWMISDLGEVYLIDWDGAMIADPALDLGLLLHTYIPKSDWPKWLLHYGVRLTPELERRMKWYTVVQTLTSVQWHKQKHRLEEMQYWINYLETFNYE